ncbi:MAG: TetR family transcriptional regulator, partial [Micromonosporaceae bacterium]|nr:TetR family transcriptional regulator [Micromonosporaceae bacterium]
MADLSTHSRTVDVMNVPSDRTAAHTLGPAPRPRRKTQDRHSGVRSFSPASRSYPRKLILAMRDAAPLVRPLCLIYARSMSQETAEPAGLIESALLDATEAAIATYGVSRLSLERVAECAGVSRATIYRRNVT